MAAPPDALTELEHRLGYTFRRRELLVLSLTHPSYAQEREWPGQSNQRLEFLGDSVLGMIIADALYERYPDEPEGFLTRRRSALVKGGVLFEIAEDIALEEYMWMGRAELNAGGRGRQSRLEDALEAVFGAIYLDGGLEATREVVYRLYGDLEARLNEAMDSHNPKGQLQEWVQREGDTTADIEYVIRETTGPDHARIFHIDLFLKGEKIGEGEASSRKMAESQAAALGLAELRRRRESRS